MSTQWTPPKTVGEYEQEFIELRDELIAKHGLDLTLSQDRGFTPAARWLARILNGAAWETAMYLCPNKRSRVRRDYKEWCSPFPWIDSNKSLARLAVRIDSLRTLLNTPTPVIQAAIQAFCQPQNWAKPLHRSDYVDAYVLWKIERSSGSWMPQGTLHEPDW
jgi:hypothetical protein